MTTVEPNAPTVVDIDGVYEGGHSYKRRVEVETPWLWEDIDDWWWDVVFEETGDGEYAKQGSCTTAKVVSSPMESMVGREYEWVD